MSTSSETHFCLPDVSGVLAIVERHSDGYPAGAGADLLKFLGECKELDDPRFHDPELLATRYVVFLADLFRYKNHPRLDFLSVRISTTPGDSTTYRYVVNCLSYNQHGDPLPKVVCYERCANGMYVPNNEFERMYAKWHATLTTPTAGI